MLKFAAAVAFTLGICWTLSAQQPGSSPPLPPNHPPVMPQGHPPVGQAVPPGAGTEIEAPPPANPEDVKSIDAIIKAYYASVSGPRGQQRDWNRLRSLMIPELHFVTTRPLDDLNMPMILTISQFIEVNGTYFEKGGYFENEIHRETDAFGNIAQAFSTYESRRSLEEPQPYSRGINSFQMLNDGRRWWIASILWDFERPHSNFIPPEYQPRKTPPITKDN